MRRRRIVVRVVLWAAAVCAMFAVGASPAGAVAGVPPLAFASVSNEPPMFLGPPSASPLVFTVHNFGPVSNIAALEMRRPSSQWIVSGCAINPPLPGWTATLTPSSCRFVSSPSPLDDLAPFRRVTADNFKVYAGTVARPSDLTGTWIVRASSWHDFSPGATMNAIAMGPNGLDTRAHSLRITDVRVGPAQTPGSPCPSFGRSADPGSTVTLVLCGTNHADIAMTPTGNVLSGSFVVSPGTYSTGSIPAGATNVVLGNREGAVVTPIEGSDHTVITKAFAAPSQTSPLTTLTGYRSRFNEPPTATDDSYSTNEDVTLHVPAAGVLANDSDPDGDPLSAVLVSGPAHGSVTLNSDGSFSYTPAADYNGADSFTYKANDGAEDSNEATVSLTVNAVNDAPAAISDAFSTDEDVVLNVVAPGVLANDSDAEGSALSAAVVTGPSNGSLTLNANGSFTYTPAANFNGSDSFTYKANDGTTDSNVATVSLTVNPVNDAPVAVNDSYATDEDVTLNVPAAGVLSNDSDVEGNALSAVLVAGPSNGSLTLNADGSFTYTPAANYSGSDSFTYKANDGAADSNVATVSLTVNSVNDAPVAVDDTATTDEDVPLTVAAPGVLANDSDAEASALSAVLVSGPSNGSLTLNADGSFTYAPAANFSGSDSFTYKANDGTADSNVATVSLTVSSVQDAPVAADDSYSTDEDQTLIVSSPGVLSNDSDADGDSLGALLVGGPVHGSVTLNVDGSFSYVPPAGYNGSDSFTYAAGDGTSTSNVATVSLTINPVNDAPAATADAFTTDEDTPLVVAVPGVLSNDSDPEGDALSAVLVSGPAAGTLSLNVDGSFTYTPGPDFSGSDSFSYKANDGAADSAPATVTLTVNPIQDAPIAADDSYSTDEDVQLVEALPGVLGNDVDADGEPLTAVLVSNPSHGTLTLNADGSFSYTPGPNYHGADSFTYKANDGTDDSNTATVSLTVDSVNDAPVAADDTAQTSQDIPLNVAAPGVLTNDSDTDLDPLSAVLVTGPANGSLTLNADGSFSYTPNSGHTGTDSFTYKANDGAADSNIATVTITILANSPPVATDDTASVGEDTVLNVVAPGVLANDTDADGDSLTAVLVAGPSNGNVTLNTNGSYTYTPNADFNGVDSFTYKANDGTADSGIATVTVTVTAENDAPVNTVPGSQTTDEDVAITFSVANGNAISTSDVDAGSSPVEVTLLVSNGTLTLSGTTGLTFTTGDGTADPSMQFAGTLTNVNAALAGLTYQPVSGVAGNDALNLTVDDQGATGSGGALTDSDTVAITVNAVNDPPVNTVPGAQAVDEDTALTFSSGNGNQIAITDPDAGSSPVQISLTATNGAITLSGTTGLSFTTGDGTADATMVFTGTTANVNTALAGMTFTGSANFFGAASLQIVTNDQGNTGSGGALSDSDSVAITVNPVNDPPVAADDTLTGANSALGNTKFHVFPGVGLATNPVVKIESFDVQGNDTDVDTPVAGFTTTAGATSTNGGTVTMNPDGEFVYVPPPGFTGIDTFTYTVHDNDPSGDATDTGTISINVAGPLVWYVDNALGAAGNGTSTSPFNALAPLSTGGGSDGLDGNGDVIFVYRGSGAYGPIVLEANQRLAGEPQGLTVTDSLARTHNLVTAAGTNPVINNGSGDAITVASGNTVQAVNVASATGSAVSGVGVNTLTIASNVNLSGAGGGGTTDAELFLDGGNGNITVAAPITGGTAGRAVVIKNRTGGTTTLSGLVSSSAGGQGVLLSINGGSTTTFSGGITLNTTSFDAFTATGGGTVNVTGATNTIATTTGVAVTITNTTIGSGGVQLQSVSANGAPNGIVLNAAGTGGFTVTGTGTTDGSGGTIQNITNRGVSAISTNSVSLSNMTFTNAGTSDAGGCDPGLLNTTCNAAIHLQSMTGATLANVDITDGSQEGINGNGVTNFSLSNSVISSVGDEVNEGGVRLVNVLGTSGIANSTITGSAEDNLYIANNSGTLQSFSVTGSTFSNTTASAPGNDGVLIKPQGTATMTISVTGSTFDNNRGDHFQVSPIDTATATVTFSNNTLTDTTGTSLGGGITINPAAGTNTTATISNNTLTGSVTSAVSVNLNTDSTAASLLKATITNNSIGTTGIANSGSEQGNGIAVVGNGAGTVTTRIANNTVHGFTNPYGIHVFSRDGSGTVNATVTGNTVGTPDATLALDAIRIEGGAIATDAGTVCADVGGSTVALRNNVTTGGNEGVGASDIRVRLRFGTKLRMPGYAGAATDTAAVQTYLAGRNDTTTVTATTSSTDPTPFANTAGGAACPQP